MKRLVVCCDGTWQKLSSSYPTNVVKIAQAVKPVGNDGTPQIVFYDEGIGAGDELDKLVGGAFGWGIDKNIQDAYRFLSLNYNEGDEIYLFGFSRGAYTVRSLAGMIYCSGLLKRPNIRSAPEAYRIYRAVDIKPSHPEAQEFRANYGERVPITLLGCWDTVGALGVPDQIPLLPIDDWLNSKYKFHDTTLSSMIQKALHAVAIDELRKVFDVTPMQKSPKFEAQIVRQVWFPGAHGCVGGGTKEQRGLSDAALQWMINEIGNLGLRLEFEPNNVEDGIQISPTIDFDNEPGIIYQVTGTKRRNITGSFNDLHESVKIRWQARSDYRPENLRKFQDALTAYK